MYDQSHSSLSVSLHQCPKQMITKEMYEALRKEVDWEQHQHPDGVVLHAAASDNSGANFRA
jgi:hypothetical protein